LAFSTEYRATSLAMASTSAHPSLFFLRATVRPHQVASGTMPKDPLPTVVADSVKSV
jgi:hypothetical protein